MKPAWSIDPDGTVHASRWRLQCIWLWRQLRAKVRYRDPWY